MKKIRFTLSSAVFCLLIGVLSVLFIILPEEEISISERRPLMKFEEVKKSENPFETFENYCLEQFPFRDKFRSLKAFLYLDVFKKNDNNGIYKQDSSVVKIEDTLDEAQVNYFCSVIGNVKEKYFKDNENVYYSVVPDKHYYASKENGYPTMDYDKMFSILDENLDGIKYIDITDKLSLSDYYKTDSHWSQEKVAPIAQYIVGKMNSDAPLSDISSFKVNTLSPFYGVYYGQSALNLPPEEIKYLSNSVTDGMVMTVIDDRGKKKEYPVYVTEMFYGNDPYDVFAAGAQHTVIIENPSCESDRELIVFRDSFASSISPILAEGYSKVTLIDLRYIVPDFVKQISGFDENSDVLFLYSTTLINGGRVLKDFMSK